MVTACCNACRTCVATNILGLAMAGFGSLGLSARRLGRSASRSIRAVKILANDERIPRPLRWMVVIGLLPIPGPFDEGVLLIVAAPLFLFYRPMMREAWSQAKVAPFVEPSH
jgi:hypothetical protein